MSSSKSSIRQRLRALRNSRLRLRDLEIATCAAVSPGVVRAARRDGREPTREPTRKRLLEFIERAEKAVDRAALGLP